MFIRLIVGGTENKINNFDRQTRTTYFQLDTLIKANKHVRSN